MNRYRLVTWTLIGAGTALMCLDSLVTRWTYRVLTWLEEM